MDITILELLEMVRTAVMLLAVVIGAAALWGGWILLLDVLEAMRLDREEKAAEHAAWLRGEWQSSCDTRPARLAQQAEIVRRPVPAPLPADSACEPAPWTLLKKRSA